MGWVRLNLVGVMGWVRLSLVGFEIGSVMLAEVGFGRVGLG